MGVLGVCVVGVLGVCVGEEVGDVGVCVGGLFFPAED